MTEQENEGAGIRVVEMSAIVSTEVSWLWDEWIAFGKISLLEADPGAGKSTVAADLAARVSTGTSMPLSTRLSQPMAVLLVAPEDSLEDIVRPRLEAAGADLSRIAVLAEAENTIPGGLDQIEEICRVRDTKMLIIDSLDDCLSSGYSPHNNHSIRRALAPLDAMASRLGIAVLIIRHLVKASGGRAISRGQGAIALGSRARSVMCIMQHPNDPQLRVLACVKTNLGPRPQSLVFEIVPEGGSAVVRWVGPTDLDADAIGGGRGASDRTLGGVARRLLIANLAAGPVAANDLFELAAKRGISKPTLRRAQEDLRIPSRRRPGGDLRWFWYSPGTSDLGLDGLGESQADPGVRHTLPAQHDHDDHLDNVDQCCAAPEAGAGDQDDQGDHLCTGSPVLAAVPGACFGNGIVDRGDA
ncbi:MAG: AAA family ATPase [Deltaproteobacteria bacterium]|nr:AAA family ATPase [Deltaproteobacteria bacterium]